MYDDVTQTYNPLYLDAVVSNPPYSQHWDPSHKETDPRYRLSLIHICDELILAFRGFSAAYKLLISARANSARVNLCLLYTSRCV